MKRTQSLFVLVAILLALILAGCSPPLASDQPLVDQHTEDVQPTEPAEPTAAVEDVQPTEEPDNQEQDGSARRVSFDQLGISLEVPEGLVVQKSPMVSYDDPGRLESYLFYIQNYGDPAGPSSGNFQIYGILQYNLPPITWDVFAQNTLTSEMNAYATEIEINGLRGFDTQLSGVRNRFVYQFLLDGQVLSLAVAEPTAENKALADQIISTLIYDPAMFTSASKVQKVVEPNGLYELYIPDDWSYSFGQAAGVRISDFQAQSADAELVIEDTDGPHSNFHYRSGIFINLVILEGEEVMMEPVMAEVIRTSEIMLAGIPMSDYVFREPSTVEGEIRELRFSHNGDSYQLRFSYATDADRLLIDWILLNLQLQPIE